MSSLPVLCIHGIHDDGAVFAPMRARLLAEGFAHVASPDLVPNDGRATMDELASQIQTAADDLRAKSGSEEIDVVGFSMGALASRYWLLRHPGRRRVRTFISISGPHRGTLTAYLKNGPGVKQMRPESELLSDLEIQSPDWGETRVHVLWTPFDLMIVPPRSSLLAGARTRSFPVLLHPWMLSDPRVIEAVHEILSV